MRFNAILDHIAETNVVAANRDSNNPRLVLLHEVLLRQIARRKVCQDSCRVVVWTLLSRDTTGHLPSIVVRLSW